MTFGYGLVISLARRGTVVPLSITEKAWLSVGYAQACRRDPPRWLPLWRNEIGSDKSIVSNH